MKLIFLLWGSFFAQVFALTTLEVVRNESDLQSLSQILLDSSVSSIASFLNDSDAVTLFAPTDTALAEFSDISSVTLLTELLNYHILNESLPSSLIQNSTFKRTLMSNPLFANVGGGQFLHLSQDNLGILVRFGSASARVQRSIVADNGVIHVVDTVFSFPRNISETLSTGFTSLMAALQSTDLLTVVNEMEGISLFAPQDPAFDDVAKFLNLSSTLQGHVIQQVVFSPALTNGTILSTTAGSMFNISVNVLADTIQVNNVRLLSTDLLVENGVVHVIEKILFTPLTTNTIAENMAAVPQLSGLLEHARPFVSIMEMLDDPAANLTLFAPSNDAIVTNTAFDSLASSEQETILLYHICDALIPSAVLVPGEQALVITKATASPYVELNGTGQNLILERFTDGEIRLIYGSPVKDFVQVNPFATDIVSSNGLIQMIDGLLQLPGDAAFVLQDLELNALRGNLTSTNLLSLVNNTQFITLFAPTDAAFEKMAGTRDLNATLASHVAPSAIWAGDLVAGATLLTMNVDSNLTVDRFANEILIDDAIVTTANIPMRNGFMHVVDRVVKAAQTDFNMGENLAALGLSTLLEMAGANPDYATFITSPDAASTLLAPTNEAFTQLGNVSSRMGSAILEYHLLAAVYPSSSLNGTQILATFLEDPGFVHLELDQPQVIVSQMQSNGSLQFSNGGLQSAIPLTNEIQCENGLIYMVDQVMLPPPNVTDVAIAQGLRGFTQVLQNLSMAETVNGFSAVTIFAPNDDAFLAVANTLTNLTEQQMLEALYAHVVADVVYSPDLRITQVLTTMTPPNSNITTDVNSTIPSTNTNTLNITTRADGIYITNPSGREAKIVASDVLSGNGVLHIIDKVLLPQGSGGDEPSSGAVSVATNAPLLLLLLALSLVLPATAFS